MKTSKSAVFLFELMIIILIFVLAAAICTQIFASAFKMSTESRELTMSSINAQTLAEQYKSGEVDIEPMYFDRNWGEIDKSAAYYRVELSERDAMPKMLDADVNVYKTGQEDAIFTLRVKEYTG